MSSDDGRHHGRDEAPASEEIRAVNRRFLRRRRARDRRSVWDIFGGLAAGLPFVHRERTRIHDDPYAPGTDPRDQRRRWDTPR